MNTSTKDVPADRRRFWSMFGVVAICAFVAVVSYGALLAHWTGSVFDKSGPFGDSFAPLNTLFAGLAFAALWASLRMQRQELALQREELRLTRQELAQSVQAQRRLAESAEKDQIARERPRVVAVAEFEAYSSRVVIRNDSQTAARQLRLTVDKSVSTYPFRRGQESAYLHDLPLFSGKGHTMAPNAQIAYPIGIAKPDSWVDISFGLQADYEDAFGNQFSETFELDLEMIQGSLNSRVGSLGAIAEKLDSIERTLSNFHSQRAVSSWVRAKTRD